MLTRSHLRHGFTLLELLVVVAVIALLLAILLPALSAASEAGRAAVCSSNLYQLGLGVTRYAEENDHRVPWTAVASRRYADYEWWVTQVAWAMDEYQPKIYRCPFDPVPYEIRCTPSMAFLT